MNLYTNPPITKKELLDREVSNILRAPKTMAEQLVNTWCQSFDSLWNSRENRDPELTITVADRLEAIDIEAVDLFAESSALCTFLVSRLSVTRPDLVEKITTRVSSMPLYTANSDGSVTLTPEVIPEEPPVEEPPVEEPPVVVEEPTVVVEEEPPVVVEEPPVVVEEPTVVVEEEPAPTAPPIGRHIAL